MTMFHDMVYYLGGVPVGSGLDQIGLNGGRVVFADAINGLDGNSGLTPAKAVKTFDAGYDLLRTNKNDTLVLMGGATGFNTTAAITWDKSYCHVLGATAPLAVGQRARIVGTTTAALGDLFTVSGNGNTFSNVQFYNGSNANAATGAVKVTGDRNFFNNCYFMGITGATSGAHASSYDLYLSTASECGFNHCAIGGTSAIHGGANYTLRIEDSDAEFYKCRIRKFDDTAAQKLVYYANTATTQETVFWDCIFHVMSTNMATACTNAFGVSAGFTHGIILKNCASSNITGWGFDNTVAAYTADPVPTAATSGLGVKINS